MIICNFIKENYGDGGNRYYGANEGNDGEPGTSNGGNVDVKMMVVAAVVRVDGDIFFR